MLAGAWRIERQWSRRLGEMPLRAADRAYQAAIDEQAWQARLAG
jgi:hypothetical protein